MHERESQNVIVARAVKVAVATLPTLARISEGASKTAPIAPSPLLVLRAGVQPVGEAVLGQ